MEFPDELTVVMGEMYLDPRRPAVNYDDGCLFTIESMLKGRNDTPFKLSYCAGRAWIEGAEKAFLLRLFSLPDIVCCHRATPPAVLLLIWWANRLHV